MIFPQPKDRRSVKRFFVLTFFALLMTGCMRAPTTSDGRTVVKALPKYAFVNAPVVDMLSRGPSKTSHTYSEGRYHHLPCSYRPSTSTAPNRLHQLLLGQIVRIVETKPFETLVEVPAAHIGSGGSIRPITGWVLSRHLIPTETLRKRKNQNFALADPHGLLGKKKKKHLALIHPYTISEAKLSLSAGTIFPLVAEQKNTFLTHIWDQREKQFRELIIPKSAAYVQTEVSRPEAARRLIGLLRYWANQKEGFIPYVLGGGSWTHNYREKRFSKKGNGKNLEYHRTEAIDNMHSGFDCTTLIYTAAQIIGIPYTSRNTTAISHQLEEVKSGSPIEPGDILLYPGHAVVISSIKPLRLLQSLGYATGYGRVVEGLAKDYIGGISTLGDLKRALNEKKPLHLLGANKKLLKVQKTWAIYRFRSCWRKS